MANNTHATLSAPDKSGTHHIFALCEEHEGGDVIRDFQILGVSHNVTALQRKLEIRKLADPYDMIKRNGLDRDDEHGFSTEYVDNVGFMACYIIAVPYIEAGER